MYCHSLSFVLVSPQELQQMLCHVNKITKLLHKGKMLRAAISHGSGRMRFLRLVAARSSSTKSSSSRNSSSDASQPEAASLSSPPTSDIKLTPSCIKRLKEVAGEDGTFLRVSVEGGGCSGFQYKFDLDQKMTEEDKVFENGGAKVVVDEVSLEYIQGSTIDFHTELIRSAFRIVENPKADNGCSCGASFAYKL